MNRTRKTVQHNTSKALIPGIKKINTPALLAPCFIRHLLIFILALLPLSVHAENPRLVPVNAPKPQYPADLAKANISEAVRVSFTVHSDGRVSDVKALESDHPKFTEASVKALEQWTFKPWVATDDIPSEMIVNAPMIFSPIGPRQLPYDINTFVRKLPCSSFNKEVALYRKFYPHRSFNGLETSSYIAEYLSNGLLKQHVSQAEMSTLMSSLATAMPAIIDHCKKNPQDYYFDQLPSAIRDLM